MRTSRRALYRAKVREGAPNLARMCSAGRVGALSLSRCNGEGGSDGLHAVGTIGGNESSHASRAASGGRPRGWRRSSQRRSVERDEPSDGRAFGSVGRPEDVAGVGVDGTSWGARGASSRHSNRRAPSRRHGDTATRRRGACRAIGRGTGGPSFEGTRSSPTARVRAGTWALDRHALVSVRAESWVPDGCQAPCYRDHRHVRELPYCVDRARRAHRW